jgi:hypothetical protein
MPSKLLYPLLDTDDVFTKSRKVSHISFSSSDEYHDIFVVMVILENSPEEKYAVVLVSPPHLVEVITDVGEGKSKSTRR